MKYNETILLDVICTFFNLTEADFLKKSNDHERVKARRYFSYILKYKFFYTYKMINNILRKDHSTISTAIHNAESDFDFESNIEKILFLYSEKEKQYFINLKPKHAYVGGQIAGLDFNQAVKYFKKASDKVKDLGYIPVLPIFIDQNLDYDTKLQKAVQMMLSCEKAFFMKNHIHSEGAKKEIEICKMLKFEYEILRV